NTPNYRRLIVWGKAHENALKAIGIVENLDRKFEVVGKQFLAAITSISANIAEGSGGYKDKEFVRFLNIALRSAFETDNWVQLIKDSKIIENVSLIRDIETRNLEVIKMLISLIKVKSK
ncbi:MAG: four helix bundle protein, partial [Candidatus Omnitrophica bacterium]|nr:four helix bundle protein [Candidatus Omnitrophota bacterium]